MKCMNHVINDMIVMLIDFKIVKILSILMENILLFTMLYYYLIDYLNKEFNFVFHTTN